MVPLASDREPNPSYGYVVSFIRLHERGFTMPASRFVWGLCYHYGVELHNFTPNAISQAATFVGVCEVFLGIPVNWDLWVHLFRAELHTLATREAQVRRAVRADGLTFALRETCRELYPPCTMMSNNADCEKGWFYLRNDGAGLPPTPARELRIFEMSDAANPMSLARSRLLQDRLLLEYAATRARCAISLKSVPHSDDDLWSFVMLPDAPVLSAPLLPSQVLVSCRCGP
jgi:hypothetical protein